MGRDQELNDLQDDLRSTAEDIGEDAERLREIEQEKAALPGGDPNVLKLARDAEALAEQIEQKASLETALAKEESDIREG